MKFKSFAIASITFMAGVLATLALPPLSYFVALFVSLCWLVYRLDRAQRFTQALGTGFIFGCGYFLSGLYWIGVSFTYLEHPLAMLLMVCALGLLSAALALFSAGACGLAYIFWMPHRAVRIVTFASSWCVGEWVRGYVIPTPFPWHFLGQAAGFSLPVLQVDAFVGPLTLSFLMICVGASPMLFFKEWSLTQITKGFTVGFILLCSLFGLGWWRLQARQNLPMTQIPLRLIQPNISQSLKMEEAHSAAILKQLIDMSRMGGSIQPHTVIIWPEAAWPYVVIGQDTTWARQIMNYFPPQTYLMTGVDRMSLYNRPHNSFFILHKTAKGIDVAGYYDKVRLVPFGEYLPAQNWLHMIGLKTFMSQNVGFVAGKAHPVFQIGHLPSFAPLICYEIIFDNAIPPASWLLNITNDVWFGRTLGPYQHLFQAQMRALEQGVPVVRTANSGISAVISPYGQILMQLPLGRAGIINTILPGHLARPWYARYGHTIFFIHISLWFLYIFLFKRFGYKG